MTDDPPPLEAGEDAVTVGVEEHLQAHRAPGRHHGPRRGSVAVSETKHSLTMTESSRRGEDEISHEMANGCIMYIPPRNPYLFPSPLSLRTVCFIIQM